MADTPKKDGEFSVESFDKAYARQQKQVRELLNKADRRAAALDETIRQRTLKYSPDALDAASDAKKKKKKRSAESSSRTKVMPLADIRDSARAQSERWSSERPAKSAAARPGGLSAASGGDYADTRSSRRRNTGEQAPETERVRRIDPLKLSKAMNRIASSLSVRSRIAAVALAALLYLTAAGTLPIPLPQQFVYMANPVANIGLSFGLMLAVVLLAFDVIATGFADLARRRAGAESLVAISALACTVYTLLILLAPSWRAESQTAPCLPVAAAAFIAMLSRFWLARAKCRSIRMAKRLTKSDTLFISVDGYKGYPTFIRVRNGDTDGFFEGFIGDDLCENAIRTYVPVGIFAAFGVSVASAFTSGNPALLGFLWAFAAITASLPSVGLLIAASLPYARVSKRMAKEGAVAGGSAELSRCAIEAFTALSENELYPPGTVRITDAKMLGATKYEVVVSYVGSILHTVGSSMAHPFTEIMKDEYYLLRRVRDVEFTGEVISAIVEGHHVILGDRAALRRFGFKTPDGEKLRTPLYVAIDAELVAVFALRYESDPNTEYALRTLVRDGRIPVITARDFNITVASVEEAFRVRPGVIVCPPIEVRVAIANPDRRAAASGVVLLKNGARPVAETVEGARRLRRGASLTMLLGIAASALSLVIMSVLSLNGWGTSASPEAISLFAALWSVPVWVIIAWIGKY